MFVAVKHALLKYKRPFVSYSYSFGLTTVFVCFACSISRSSSFHQSRTNGYSSLRENGNGSAASRYLKHPMHSSVPVCPCVFGTLVRREINE